MQETGNENKQIKETKSLKIYSNLIRLSGNVYNQALPSLHVGSLKQYANSTFNIILPE